VFQSLAEVEAEHIRRVMDHCDHDVLAASRILRISVQALQKRLVNPTSS
jgi:ActR/RegA family two-component response regulator